tara:strand:- start:164 stop:952 length:789 start_codon:yes stop_codon:yes gene_type:complete
MRILVLIFLILSPVSSFADITGSPRVVDGDTIHIGKIKIRLWGYDSPEQKQTCTIKSKPWNCGQAATEHLKKFIGDNPVTCVQKDKDRYGRIVAKCAVGTLDIGAEMVEVGLAIPYWKYSGKYYTQSYKEARGLGRGMHAGTFIEPWVWRKSQRRKKTQMNELRYTCRPTLPIFCHNIHVSCSGRTNIPTSPFAISISKMTAVLNFEDKKQSISGHATQNGDLVINFSDSRAWIRIETDGNYSHRIYPKGDAAMSYGVCEKK